MASRSSSSSWARRGRPLPRSSVSSSSGLEVVPADAIELDLNGVPLRPVRCGPVERLTASPPRTARMPRDVVTIGVLVYSAFELALGLVLMFASGWFYRNVGPFGPKNVHYIRDN